jgi:hypothetical protein
MRRGAFAILQCASLASALLLTTCGSRTQFNDDFAYRSGGMSTTPSGSVGQDTMGQGDTCAPIGLCGRQFDGSCRERDVCACNACGCKQHACMTSEPCLAIYNCMTLTNCFDLLNCYFQCGAFISGHEDLVPMASSLYVCADARCPRCVRPTFDAGPACPSLPAPIGPVQCDGEGGGGPGTCEEACHDNVTKYEWHCANGSCRCVFDAKEICQCNYRVEDGCHECCPFWGEMARR